MESIDLLKQEILNQKKEIENKGGVVNVANLNPSPAEITAGIKTIEMPNFSSATATEDDVANGKTFYAGDSSGRGWQQSDAPCLSRPSPDGFKRRLYQCSAWLFIHAFESGAGSVPPLYCRCL